MSKQASRRVWMSLLIVFLVADAGVSVAVLFPRSWNRLKTCAEEAILNPSGSGFQCLTHWDSEGNPHRYSVFVPFAQQPASKNGLPVILYLNGFGKNGDDGVKQLLDGIAPVIWNFQEHCPFLVIFPQCHEGETWEGDSSASLRALAILDESVRRFGGDPSRVCLTGLSSGGNGVWKIAAAHPGRFVSLVPISSVCPVETASRISNLNLPIWSFYVREDSQDLVRTNRKMHQELVRFGVDCRFTEIDGSKLGGKNLHDAWDFAFRNQALGRWILRQERQGKFSPRTQFQNLFETLNETARETGWRLQDGVLSVDGSMSSDKRLQLTKKIPASFRDLRLEFNPPADASWQLVIHDQEDLEKSCGFSVNFKGRPEEIDDVISLNSEVDHEVLDPNSIRSIRSGEWNEMEIRWVGNQCEIEINGWPATQLKHEPTSSTAYVTILAGPSSTCRWQNLRVASLTKSSESKE